MNRWIRHRERSAAIHGGVLWCSWIAAACGLAMTDEGVVHGKRSAAIHVVG
jgi:hypothetical protein